MSELQWQKSTFSEDQANCVYVAPAPAPAPAPARTIRLRESDTPDVILATAPEGLAALLRHLKSRG
ncbi:DUF397 domain-containing protein [Streptomyces sp. NPDC058469]|uniref:DUF397 domain-containing protein n=1 Tax=Streptomyces sp. NPDC058469 TaxID=3346514 RepID=UPI0036641C8E